MDLRHVKEIFDSKFASWEISFPEEDLHERIDGEILKEGWTILYRFGREGEREYLQVYDIHRMVGDSHYRIFSTGEVEALPVHKYDVTHPTDATDEQRRDAVRRLEQHNREVSEMFNLTWGAALRRVADHMRLLLYLGTGST